MEVTRPSNKSTEGVYFIVQCVCRVIEGTSPFNKAMHGLYSHVQGLCCFIETTRHLNQSIHGVYSHVQGLCSVIEGTRLGDPLTGPNNSMNQRKGSTALYKECVDSLKGVAPIKTQYWDRAGGGGNISYDW